MFECCLAFFDGAGAEEDVPGWRGFGEELAGEFEADAAVCWGLVSCCVFEWSFAVLIGRGLPPVINAMSFLSVMVGSDQLLSCEGMVRWRLRSETIYAFWKCCQYSSVSPITVHCCKCR